MKKPLILLLTSLMFVSCSSKDIQDDPEEVIKKYIQLMEEDNWSAAVPLLARNCSYGIPGLDDKNSFFYHHDFKGDDDEKYELTLHEKNRKKDYVEFDAKIKYKKNGKEVIKHNGGPYADFVLIKKDGKWLLKKAVNFRVNEQWDSKY
ncbi:MAG: hypothetical protein KGV43_02865 [Arcobacter sp.]|nr:hypothetical protein [Arcobacter sp.]